MTATVLWRARPEGPVRPSRRCPLGSGTLEGAWVQTRLGGTRRHRASCADADRQRNAERFSLVWSIWRLVAKTTERPMRHGLISGRFDNHCLPGIAAVQRLWPDGRHMGSGTAAKSVVV